MSVVAALERPGQYESSDKKNSAFLINNMAQPLT